MAKNTDELIRFHIERKSVWDKKPCREAFKGEYVWTDWRTVDAPQKIPAYRDKDPSWWYEEGRNHRVVKGQIGRDFDKRAWFVELRPSEILDFAFKYSPVVISEPDNSSVHPRIMIDDGY